MLVLADQRLVVLEAPKTGSLALRAALEPFADPLWSQVGRHTGMAAYRRYHERGLTIAFGCAPETIAVMREPLRRLQSWYRYRLRPQVKNAAASTRNVSFDAFVAACLADDPPAYARVGRQDRFLGWDGKSVPVDHLFDYNRLELLTEFLGKRLGHEVVLPQRNVSPACDPTDYSLSDATLARLLAANETEFAIYRQLRRKGCLRRQKPALSSSAR